MPHSPCVKVGESKCQEDKANRFSAPLVAPCARLPPAMLFASGSAAVSCRTAGFQSGLCLLWVIHDLGSPGHTTVHVRFTPKSVHRQSTLDLPLRAKPTHGPQQTALSAFEDKRGRSMAYGQGLHSITRSACTSTETGIVMPNSFATFRFTVSSKRVGCMIGSSAGLVPRTTFSTYKATLWAASS